MNNIDLIDIFIFVLGSVEPKAANYEVEIRIQDGRQNEEMIHDMKQATKNLLIKFHAANKVLKS